MRKTPIILLCLFSIKTMAGDINETIFPLGITSTDLKSIWHDGRCDKNWSLKLEKQVFADKSLLGHKAVESRFFKSKERNGEIVLTPGTRCTAINRYYFKKEKKREIIEFIRRDEEFIREYGYSVLDAIYVEGTQFYSWNGEVSEFRLKYARTLVEKGLYTLMKKASTFNGVPSVAYSGERTAAGDAFHDKVFQKQ